MEKYCEMKIDDYIAELASKSPVPGGGGTCALVGALAAALGNMVGSLTVGKKKYAAVESQMKELMQNMTDVENELLSLVDRDAVAFEPLSRAYGLPKNTPGEQAYKDEVMEKCLNDAASVPLDIMRASTRAIDILAQFAAKGSAIAVSDAGVGVLFAKAAIEGAALNVFINTKYMKDTANAAEINKEVKSILLAYPPKAQAVYENVLSKLSG